MWPFKWNKSAKKSALCSVLFGVLASTAAADLPVNVNFDPISVAPTQETRLTLTLFNPTNSVATDVALTSVLPAGLSPSATPDLSSSCSAVSDTVLNTTTTPAQVELTDGTIPSAVAGTPGQCEISLDVVADGGGSFTQVIPAGALTGTVNGVNDSNANPAQATVVSVVSEIRPQLSLVEPGTTRTVFLRGGETPELLIALENTNTIGVTGVDFSLPLTSGTALEMRVAPAATATLNSCGTATPSDVSIARTAAAAPYTEATTINISDVEIAAGATCEIRVPVIAGRAITENARSNRNNNVITYPAGAVTSNQNATNTAGTFLFAARVGLASEFVFDPQQLSLVNGPASATARYTFFNNNAVPVTNFGFEDELPADLNVTGLIANTCTGPSAGPTFGNANATNGRPAFQITGSDLAAAPVAPFTNSNDTSSCVIEVEVTPARGGSFLNLIEISQTLNADNGNFTIFDFRDSLVVSEGALRVNALTYETSEGILTNAAIRNGDDYNIVLRLTNDSVSDTIENLTGNLDFGAFLAARSEIYRDGGVDPIVSASCGTSASVTAVDGATIAGMSAIEIAPEATCEIRIPAIIDAGAASSFGGPIINAGDFTYNLLGDATTRSNESRISTGLLFPSSPFQTTKRFVQTPIAPGAVSTLEFTLNYTESFGLDRKAMGMADIAFTDNLPAGHVVADTPNIVNGCGGTVTAAAGSSSISVATGSATALTPGDSCQISVDVVAPPLTPGEISEDATNVVPAIDVTARDIGQAAPVNTFTGTEMRATLTRRASAAGVSTEFAPILIDGGGVSRVRTVIANVDTQAIDLTGVALSDTLPSGIVVAQTANPTFTDTSGSPNANGCFGGTFAGAPGDATFALSDASVDRNARCYLEFNVQGFSGGTFVNEIPALTLVTDQGVTNQGLASATLTVDQNVALTKEFSSDAQIGTNTTLTLTIFNTSLTGGSATPETGASPALVDVLPAGMTVAGPVTTTCSGASVSFDNPASGRSTITVDGGSYPPASSCTVTAPVTAAASGDYTNTILNGGLRMVSGASNPNAAEATVTFFDAALDVIKTASATTANGTSNTNTDAQDVITYSIAVRNSGDVTLTDVRIQSDALTRGDATILTLPAPTLAGGATTIDLAPNETATFTTTYTIQQADVNSGRLSNTATAVGTPPAGADVTDISGTSTGTDTPTVTTFTAAPALTLVKTSTLDLAVAGDAAVADATDEIDYTYVVTNTGNVTLTGVGVAEPDDATNDFSGAGAAPTPTLQAGSSTTLAPGEQATFIASYPLEQADIDAGSVTNSAVATGSSPGNTNDVTDTSDDGNTTNGADNPTVTTLTAAPQIRLVKEAVASVDQGISATASDADDMVTYTFTATNTGNVTLTSLSIAELTASFTGNNGTPAPARDTIASTNTTAGTLQPGESEVWTASYTINQDDVDQGSVENRAEVTASSPGNADDVTDQSQNAAGAEDVTVVTLTATPAITLVKGAAVSVDQGTSTSATDADDIVTYTFTATNTGGVTLTDIAVAEIVASFTGNNGTPTPARDDVASTNATAGTLLPGESEVWTADYTINQDDVDQGGIENRAEVTASSPGNTDDVTDQSENAGGAEAVTMVTLTPTPAMALVKTATPDFAIAGGAAVADPGDQIAYRYVVTNTGNVTLTNVGVAEPNAAPNLFSGAGSAPTPSLEAGSSTTLAPGESAAFIATYALLQADVDAGELTNSALATASSPGNTNDVTDTSDDGNPANGADNPTEVSLPSTPALTIVKTGLPTVAGGNNPDVTDAGDTIAYTLTVTNIGNVTLTDVQISADTLSLGINGMGTSFDMTSQVTFDGNSGVTPVSPNGTLAPGEIATFVMDYTITAAAAEAGGVSNIAETRAQTPGGGIISAATAAAAVTEVLPSVDIDVVEQVLSDDLIQTVTMLSTNVSRISRDAADRLRIGGGRACGAEINALLQQTPVRFANDSFVIDATNDALLDEITRILNSCETAEFRIDGHTSSPASDAYNVVLSQNRVNAVKAALVARGIASERLQTRGFGESRPIATNATAEGQALNRRVEFTFIDEGIPQNHLCGVQNNRSGGLNAGANDAGQSLSGNGNWQGYDCRAGVYAETWSELNLSRNDDRGTMGMLNLGTLRERQADGSLFGRFIEGYVSRNEVQNPDATGIITGVGVHAGLYAAHGTTGGLILSYYGSAAAGQHEFELDAGGEVEGNYRYAAVFAGGAIGGKLTRDNYEIRPRVGVDLAYGKALGSEISVPGVDLEIDPATLARGYAEIGLANTMPGGTLTVIPRLFCTTTGDDGTESCGAGTSVSFQTATDADVGTEWDVSFDYEAAGDQQSASFAIARSSEVFDGAGVSRSSFGASQTGSLQVEQRFEFNW